MRPSISLTIHLDEPCQENWNNIEPTEQGRFCNKCEKPVIKVPGRFRRHQRGQVRVTTSATPKKAYR